MKKITKWVIIVLVLSGWIAFGIGYSVSHKEIAKCKEEINKLNSEINSYKMITEDVKKSSEEIDKIIQQLNTLKYNLEKLEEKSKTIQ